MSLDLFIDLRNKMGFKVLIAVAMGAQLSYSNWSDVGYPKVKPRVWVHSDIHPPNTGGDQDDLVAMTMFLQFANLMDIKGVTAGIDVDGTPSGCASTKKWLEDNHWADYAKDVANMNAHFGGYPTNIPLYQSGFCEVDFSGETGAPKNINDPQYLSMKEFIKAAAEGVLWVSSWGETSEFAEIIKYLKAQNTPESKQTLKNIKLVPHWLTKGNANCDHASKGCAYVYKYGSGPDREFDFYNIGDIGQRGLVQNSCNENFNLNIPTIEASNVGKNIKWKPLTAGTPDMSDGSSFLVLLGIAGGIESFKPDGSIDAAKTNAICKDRQEVWKYWERAAKAATGVGTFAPPYPSTSIHGTPTQESQFEGNGSVTYKKGVLQFMGDFQSNTTIRILNTQGQVFFSTRNFKNTPLYLKDGLYVVEIQTGSSIQSHRLALIN